MSAGGACGTWKSQPLWSGEPFLYPLQFADVQTVLGPVAARLHVDEVVDRRHEEGAFVDGYLGGALAEPLEPVTLTDEQIDLGAAVGSAEVLGQHVLVDAPTADLLYVANGIEGFGNSWAGAEGPEQIDGGLPGIGGEAGHDVEVERGPGTAVEGGGDASDDHEVDIVVMKLIQNSKKPAGHETVVP